MVSPPVSRVLSANQIAFLAKQAGFPDKDVPIAVAIALAESKGDIAAYNGNAATGDDSYGLWQINMKGDLGPARRKMFGIESNDQLFGYGINAKAAFTLYANRGGTFKDWSTYNSGKYAAYVLAGTRGAESPENPDNTLGPLGNPTNTQIGGKIPDLLKDFVLWVLGLFGPVLLRIAGFVGGGLLILVAIVLYVRKGQ